MKNAIFNTLARLAKPVAATLVLVSLLSSVSAQPEDKVKDAPFEVKYIGSVSGKPLFQISFLNPTAEEVSVTLRDENGFTIFNDVTKEKSYTKKLQFNEMDSDKLKLVLTLRSKKDTQSQTFEVTKNTRTIEDVAVVAL